MKKIKIEKLDLKKFNEFGSYINVLNPSGTKLCGEYHEFYRDAVLMHSSGNMPVGFSSIIVKKHLDNIVGCLEYHTYTEEVMLPLDDDAILCVSPSGLVDDMQQNLRAFLIPKGTLVTLRSGTWHYLPLPVNNEKLTALIVLPERVYANDLIIKELDDKVSLV